MCDKHVSVIGVVLLSGLVSGCGAGGNPFGEQKEPAGPAHREITFPEDNAPPLEYEGENGAAMLTADNVSPLLYNILSRNGGQTDPLNIDLTLKVGELASLTPALAKGSDKHTPASGMVAIASTGEADQYRNANLSEMTVDCEQGSYRRVTDHDSPRRQATVYSNCRRYGITRHGTVTVTRDTAPGGPEGVLTTSMVEFRRLTLTHANRTVTVSGSIKSQTHSSEGWQRKTVAVVAEHENSGRRVKADYVETLEYTDDRDEGRYRKTIDGRIYDSEHGYLELATTLPLANDSEAGVFSPFAGKLRLKGRNNRKAVVTLRSETVALIELDIDADEAFEYTAYLNLEALLERRHGSIVDSDGDGMHDSWESFYGLNPADPGDAEADKDGDGISNLDEYKLGAGVTNSNIKPASTDLQIAVTDDSDTAFPEGREAQLQYRLLNRGTSEAENVAVTYNFPAGVDVTSVNTWPDAVCHSEADRVMCFYRRIDAGTSRTTAITVTLSGSPDRYDLEHSIASTTLNREPANNTYTGALRIQPASAELSITANTSRNPAPSANYYTFTFEITNTGALPATDLSLVYTLPDDTLYGGGDYHCDTQENAVTCTYDSLAPGATLEVSDQVRTMRPPGSTSEISATVSSDTAELDVSDNAVTLITDISEPVNDVSVTVRGGWVSSLSGETFNLRVSTSRNGPDFLRQIEVTAELPPSVEIVEASSLYGECAGDSTVVCTLAVDHRRYMSATYTLTSSTPGIHRIPISISHSGIDPDTSNNSDELVSYIGQPVDDIAAQIEAAGEGDTVTVPPGYYFGNLWYTDKSIQLVSEEGPETTFFSGDPQNTISGAVRPGPGGEISGFSFVYTRGFVLNLYSSEDITISNNVFAHLYPRFGDLSIRMTNQANPVIEKNIFRNLDCEGGSDGAIQVDGDYGGTIRNNLFYNNECTAVEFSTWNTPVPRVVNNTVVNNNTGLLIPENARGEGALIANNIVYGNRTGIETQTDCGAECAVFQSNLLFDNEVDYSSTQDQTGVNGNMGADPLFNDPSNADYSLQAGSPAIDAGNPAEAPAEDFAGNPRPVDGDGSGSAEPDIGAYERQ